jgi:hypothetical protein
LPTHLRGGAPTNDIAVLLFAVSTGFSDVVDESLTCQFALPPARELLTHSLFVVMSVRLFVWVIRRSPRDDADSAPVCFGAFRRPSQGRRRHVGYLDSARRPGEAVDRKVEPGSTERLPTLHSETTRSYERFFDPDGGADE